MKSLIEGFFARPGAVLLTLILIFVNGVFALVKIPKEAEPDIQIPNAYISIVYQGISPVDSEKLLLKPLEKHLKTVPGLKEIKSNAGEGYASISLEFAAGEDVDQAISDVRQAVDDAKPYLPNGSEEPKIIEINISEFPVFTAALFGELPEHTLVFSARQLEEHLESITGVLDVEIQGDRDEILEILIDASIAETYGLDPNFVIGMVAANNQLVTAGAIDSGVGRLVIKVPGVIESLDDILSMPIKVSDNKTIKFSDVAVVRRTFREANGWSRVNSESAVVLDLSKRVGTNLIEVVDKAKVVLVEAKKELPQGVNISYLFDKSEDIKRSLNNLGNNVVTAILIVLIVVVVALGVKNALLIGLAIPASFLLGIAILHGFGITMNFVVLFALILVAGLLVDNVIVTTEYADRKLARGSSRKMAYQEGATRMAWPIISSTATTLVVFMPLLAWPGIVGEFMKYLPITVICVLSSSLLMALFFIPVIGSLIGKKKQQLASNSINKAPSSYRWLLKKAIRNPFITISIVITVIVFCFYAYIQKGLGIEFFPKIDPQQAELRVQMRGDFSASEKDKFIRKAESVLNKSSAGVETFFARSRSTSSGSRGGPRDTIGFVRTIFEDWDIRQEKQLKSVGELMDKMRQEVAKIEGIKISLAAERKGPGVNKPIHIEVIGDDLNLVGDEIKRIRQIMEKFGGFKDITDNRPLPGIEWTIVPNRDAAARHGVSIEIIGTMLKMLTRGVKVADYRPTDTDDEIDVVLRLLSDQRDLDRLRNLRIPSANGEYVPLSVFADFKPKPKRGILERKNGLRYMYIDADVDTGNLPKALTDKLRKYLTQYPPNENLRIEFGGDDTDINETRAFLSQSFGYSLVMIIIILMIQFNSGWQTFVAMSAIVLSTGGIMLLLYLANMPFGIVMCGLGVISLAGIVLNNNIVLIDTYNEFIKKGRSPASSAFHAGLIRFRPVILTSITTVLGLLPMVFGLTIQLLEREIFEGSPDSQWWTQLSSTIAGGLTFATVLTLLATPALLVLGPGISNYLNKLNQKNM